MFYRRKFFTESCCAALLGILFLVGCESKKEATDPHQDHDHSSSGHHHHPAPHGGTLAVLGDEFAHLEFVLDAEEGHLTLYILDGSAENGVKISQAEVQLQLGFEASSLALRLNAVTNDLSGDKPGSAAEFKGMNSELRGKSDFEIHVLQISIKGQTFKDLKFNFPKGNE